MFTLSVHDPDWRKAVEEMAVSTEAKVRVLLETVGRETVGYLKSRTEQERGWMVRSGELAGSYAYEIKPVRGGTMLILRVDADHAIYLEARDGLFVISGVLDRGGPVERALIAACAQIAPELTVVTV